LLKEDNTMSNKELDRRKTFAIISHPDAGKTTLTEKLLLFGGAIKTAGAVKSNKIKQSSASDFMEIEKQRGISVATSVMSFEYDGKKINILDTPGHKDFAEDTYRTLTAVDSVILVVDSAKGVEEQTEKLMRVCRMRNTPVIIFVNKLDRDGKDPLSLLEELENKLNISVRPLTLPINQGFFFKGVYSLYKKEIHLFEPGKNKLSETMVELSDIYSQEIEKFFDKKDIQQLRDDTELIEEVYETFDKEMYTEGLLAPVFFGSAINNFGVKELLDTFIEIAPTPRAREAVERDIDPEEKDFTGFIFKIHANLDPNHRNRIAFLRVCSGKFERNKFYTNTRLKKQMRFSNPVEFMASARSITEEGFPGDVIGLYDSGNFKIGDTFTEGESLHYKGIPSFSPEIFREVENLDAMKSKQLDKGLKQLTEEGVAQLFVLQHGSRKIIGTVGDLQFEVIRFRLEHEYGAKCSFRPLDFKKACWFTSNDKKALDEFYARKGHNIALDRDDRPVLFVESDWMLQMAQEGFPKIKFFFTSEFESAQK
jgi:peptide chain release factor 3